MWVWLILRCALQSGNYSTLKVKCVIFRDFKVEISMPDCILQLSFTLPSLFLLNAQPNFGYLIHPAL